MALLTTTRYFPSITIVQPPTANQPPRKARDSKTAAPRHEGGVRPGTDPPRGEGQGTTSPRGSASAKEARHCRPRRRGVKSHRVVRPTTTGFVIDAGYPGDGYS